jgi:putative phosphoesterase
MVMKYLVVADTHGNISRLNQVFEKHKNEITGIIHLGDFSQDLNSLFIDTLEKYVCIGNMDGIPRKNEDLEHIIKIANKKILLTHSDHLNTHFNLNPLLQRAKELNVDLCLFGHTHTVFMDNSQIPMLFNPGSLGKPTIGTSPSYAILEINNNKLSFNLRELNI